MLRYFLVYKPFQVLCQFSPDGEKQTLRDIFPTLPTDVYPVGRLDYDSEGMLLITNDKKLNHRLLNPNLNHERAYWVQVDGNITPEAMNKLQKGIGINIDGKIYKTKPSKCTLFQDVPNVPERIPPIRVRKSIPAPWIELILTEGKNRQVRKMTAAVGFPTLRLIRHRIGSITLESLGLDQPGLFKELGHEDLNKIFRA